MVSSDTSERKTLEKEKLATAMMRRLRLADAAMRRLRPRSQTRVRREGEKDRKREKGESKTECVSV